MTNVEWLVVAAGLGAIAWINWYFFIAGSRTSAVAVSAVAADAAGTDVTVIVDGGYTPSRILARVGQPLRIAFDRRDSGNCSEEVVFPDFGIRRFLPTGKRTVVEVTPTHPGTYEFMCGMSMLRGTLVAEE